MVKRKLKIFIKLEIRFSARCFDDSVLGGLMNNTQKKMFGIMRFMNKDSIEIKNLFFLIGQHFLTLIKRKYLLEYIKHFG